jgi:hypothetical protein
VSEADQDAETLRLMASIRRLKAALAPGISKAAVVSELRKILESDGIKNLLADAGEGYFAGILRKARECMESSMDDEGSIGRLETLLNSPELEAALLTDDPDEQPQRLRDLMLEGPYRGVERAGHCEPQ